MKFLSLEPFIPSGSDFDRSKDLFRELGFAVTWDAGDYVGFEQQQTVRGEPDDQNEGQQCRGILGVTDGEKINREVWDPDHGSEATTLW